MVNDSDQVMKIFNNNQQKTRSFCSKKEREKKIKNKMIKECHLGFWVGFLDYVALILDLISHVFKFKFYFFYQVSRGNNR